MPGLKPISGMERFSRWTKVQFPLLKQGAPTDRNSKVSDIGRGRLQGSRSRTEWDQRY